MSIDTITLCVDSISSALAEFLKDKVDGKIDATDKLAIYTQSGKYLTWTYLFHQDPEVADFLLSLTQEIDLAARIVDVGCCAGFTGQTLAMNGFQVDFHDYEGLGLQFCRQQAKKERWSSRAIPYGDEIGHYNWALALDVLEHTGNHLACVRWLAELADNVAITYPVEVAFGPPYVSVIDEWVDDEAVQQVIKQRYQVSRTRVANGRRFTVFHVKHGGIK